MYLGFLQTLRGMIDLQNFQGISMKKALFFTTFFFFSALGYTEDLPFFLSSEAIVQEKQGSLKDLRAFTFFPLVKMEKNVSQTIELIHQELKKVGTIVKKPVLTSEGADLSAFSHPTLQLTIEQLVDQSQQPLPILQAILSISRVAEVVPSKELVPVSTNRWSVFLRKTNDVQEAVKRAFPLLLSQFMTDFQRANTTDQKPTFYISYDDSWWKAPRKSD